MKDASKSLMAGKRSRKDAAGGGGVEASVRSLLVACRYVTRQR